ncbi:exodeoxyribonuclease VII small subunit [Candidatus Poriferisocius sp.]|uniref:exodeoxyribonuclease VII small subunit n=1 Tax=Candidatus Poriferisocius sp. TaxID=3101276 RepID=UPI003B52F36A
MSTPEIGYADALSELQQILGELEAEDIDIDVLATKVERAAELIRVCRGRINDAEVRVKEIVAGLDHQEDEPSPADNEDDWDDAFSDD